MRWGVSIVFAILLLSYYKPAYSNSFGHILFQRISIHTPGLEYAHCTLKSGNKKYVLLSPQTITVKATSKVLSVTCEKANYNTVVKNIEPELFREYSNNRSADRVNYKYPEAIIIDMKPVSNVQVASAIDTEYLVDKFIEYMDMDSDSDIDTGAEDVPSVDLILKHIDTDFNEEEISQLDIKKEELKLDDFSDNEIASMDLEEDKFPDMKIPKEALKAPKIIPKVLK